MAKFKKGDKVVSASGNRGVVDEVFGDEKYAVRFDGCTMPDRVEGYRLRAANAAVRSSNSIVANALAAKGGAARNANGRVYSAAADLQEVRKILTREVEKQKENAVHWIKRNVEDRCRSLISVLDDAIDAADSPDEKQKASKLRDEYKKVLAQANAVCAKFDAIRL